MTSSKPAYRMTVLDALVEKKHAMTAVILRDMRSRFFNHGLGFLIVSLWPLAHMLILTGLYTVTAPVFALMMIVVYITSGTLFVTASFPEPVAYALSWNPVFHSVEWMRLAYYLGYSDKWLDKTYLISYGAISLCAGLLLERLLRMRMKEG